MTTLADILAEQSTDKRGTCVQCKRDGVALNDADVCLPCHMKTPGLDAAIDRAAETITDALIGRASKEPKS